MKYQDTLKNIKLADMKEILSGLQTYRDMKKKLWNRWAHLFHKQINKAHDYTVEYFSSLGEDTAFERAGSVYKKSFQVSPKREEIRFVVDDSVKGWMKVYFDDSMVDMSFKKVENKLQK